MEDFKNFDLMRRYSLGKMPSGERSDFEQRLTHDPALASEWEEYRLIANAIAHNKQGSSEQEEALRAAQEELRAEGFFDEVYGQIRDHMVQAEQSVSIAPVPEQQDRSRGRVRIPRSGS